MIFLWRLFCTVLVGKFSVTKVHLPHCYFINFECHLIASMLSEVVCCFDSLELYEYRVSCFNSLVKCHVNCVLLFDIIDHMPKFNCLGFYMVKLYSCWLVLFGIFFCYLFSIPLYSYPSSMSFWIYRFVFFPKNNFIRKWDKFNGIILQKACEGSIRKVYERCMHGRKRNLTPLKPLLSCSSISSEFKWICVCLFGPRFP